MPNQPPDSHYLSKQKKMVSGIGKNISNWSATSTIFMKGSLSSQQGFQNQPCAVTEVGSIPVETPPGKTSIIINETSICVLKCTDLKVDIKHGCYGFPHSEGSNGRVWGVSRTGAISQSPQANDRWSHQTTFSQAWAHLGVPTILIVVC